MDKVLVWGTGGAYAMYYHEMKAMEDAKKLCVLALVDKEAPSGKLEGYPVITKEQICQYAFDKILIAAHGGGTKSILEDAKRLGITPDKMISCDEYLKKYGDYETFYKEDIKIQTQVLKEILAASDAEVCDYTWMYEKVCRYGIYCFQKGWRSQPEIRWTRRGMLQIAEEFARFSCFISQLFIENAIEVGVFKGRSSYFICALLSRKNPAMKYVLVDIVDELDSFECYREILPALDKQIPSTSKDFSGQSYDFVFIDGDHSYEGVIEDWNNVGKYGKQMIVFHDIFAHEYDGENGGVVRAWKEIQESDKGMNNRIFSEYPDEWMGIGCVLQ